MTSRRQFIRKSALALLPMALLGGVLPRSMATAGTAAAPKRARGSTVLDVRNFGAQGDGTHDDTVAFQKAIDALPDSGGTVVVPAGNYVIDPTRNVRLRSKMHLKLADGAVLRAKRNSAERAYVLMVYKVSDVEISGGSIVGDRDTHIGTTGEWGHAIMVRGSSRVTVRDIHLSRCWGDGLSIGGAMVISHRHPAIPSTDVFIARVVSTGNRRQGLTIGRSRNVRVYDSEFSDTRGVLPACGIDIEPDAGGTARQIHIENCVVQRNERSGIQIYKRSSDVTIQNCTIENNGGYGVLVIGSVGGAIVGNRVSGNAFQGLGLRKGALNYRVSENILLNNSTRKTKSGSKRK